jgi:rhamnulokinase
MAGRRCRGRDRRSRPPGAAAPPAARPAARDAQRGAPELTKRLAAVDLGAQSGRVAVGTFDGDSLAVEELHRFANVPVEENGILFWDALRLRDEVTSGLRRAGAVALLDSVAVDSWGVDFGLVDRAGELLRNPVHYRDGRRAAAFDAVLERIPARELYDRTAIQLMPINTVFELAAMAADGAAELASAYRLLMIPDLFHRWLCGSESTEWTNATTTQCYDPRAGDWARDLLDRLGVPTAILPDVVEPGTVLGSAPDFGGTAVVATATHDTGAAVAAVPLENERSAYLSIGTWSLVGIESSQPVGGDAAFRANVTNEGGVAGTYRVLRNITGLWLVEECRRAWAGAGRAYESGELVELARSAPPLRSLIDPNDPRFGEPGDMPARIAGYCIETGQDAPADDAATVRCILESLALKHAETIELLAELSGRSLEVLHVVGGGARNDLLCAWTAQASQRRVLAGPAEATLIGNLLVQAIALDELGSLEEGRELVRRSFTQRRHDPVPDAAWQEARERFARLERDTGVAA